MDAELLRVWVVGGGVAVVEDDLKVAVWEHNRVGALIEVTVVRFASRVEEVAEEAERGGAPADLLRSGPGDPVVGGHRAKNRRAAKPARVELRVDAPVVENEYGPRRIHIVPIRARGECVRGDELLVVEDAWVVVLDDDEAAAKGWDIQEERPLRAERRLRHIDHAGVGEDIKCDATEEAPAQRVEGRGGVAAGIVSVESAGVALDRVAVRIAPCRRLHLRVVDLLTEWRQQIAPALAVVGGEGDAALVEAEAAVVLASDEVLGIGGIENDLLLSLAAERAVLVNADRK